MVRDDREKHVRIWRLVSEIMKLKMSRSMMSYSPRVRTCKVVWKYSCLIAKMLHSLRWLLTTVLFNCGVAYAAFTAFRHPYSTEVLKLWMILGTLLAATSLVGDSVCALIPLFFEIRCVFVWGLIILEPVAWGKAYDNGCAPTLTTVASAVRGLRQSSGVKSVILFVLASATQLLQRAMSAAATTGVLIEGGKVRKALDEVQEILHAEREALQIKAK